MRALWNDTEIANSDSTVVVEGNHYFAAGDVDANHLRKSATAQCAWKGTAHYYDVVVDGKVNHDAAWYYPEPKPAAAEVRDRIAFWRGVDVRE